jgi:hypothetical protein
VERRSTHRKGQVKWVPGKAVWLSESVGSGCVYRGCGAGRC